MTLLMMVIVNPLKMLLAEKQNFDMENNN